MSKKIPPSHITANVYEFPIQMAEDIDKPDDFFKSLKGFLIIGKVIGVLPFSGVFGGNSSKDLIFRRRSLTSLLTHLIFASLIFETGLSIIGSFRASKRNALEIAKSAQGSASNVWGTLIFLTFLVRGHQFIEIFTVWNRKFVVYSKKDDTFRRDVLLISSVIMVSAILENLVLHLEFFNSLDKFTGVKFNNKTNNMTLLEAYYWRGHPHWAEMISYHWIFAVIAFIQHKWILYAWNYVDICIAVFGRAMYFRFKMLCDVAEEKLLGQRDTLKMKNAENENSQNRGAWLQIVRDHENLCRLLGSLERFFSPLIFASFAVNIFYICLQLLEGLTSEVSKYSIVHSVYAPWSFFHLLARVFWASIWCARINIYAHKITKVLQMCPLHCYSAEISRFDRRVISGPDIGLTGLGCFVVRKPFILSILSVVFTVEIVLLQCVPTLMTQSVGGVNCPK